VRIAARIGGPAFSLAVAVALGVVWQLAVPPAAFDEVPTPSRSLAALATLLADGRLAAALVVSWTTVLEGFFTAVVLGVGLGLAAGYWRGFAGWIEPILNLLRPIAPFAWIPMAILWFGAGGGAGIMITAYAAFFPVVTNTLGGVARIRGSLVVAARTLGASEWTILRRIILPGALPLLLVGLRLGIGLAWAAVIAAELATGQSTNAPPGVGYLMYLNFAVEADVNAIVAMMLAIGVSALIADIALRWLARRLVHWPAER
jgi:NitT/TauT family transport system permease protein/taurine transport system permease protein/sulfonate transport system permease protein